MIDLTNDSSEEIKNNTKKNKFIDLTEDTPKPNKRKRTTKTERGEQEYQAILNVLGEKMLLKHLKNINHPKMLDAFSSFFSANEFVEPKDLEHCFRCHKMFDSRYNNKNDCVIFHSYDGDEGGRGEYYKTRCCGME